MRLHIAVYAFDGVTMFHLSIPQAVFGSVARLGLADWEVGLFTTRPAPGWESPESGIDSPASIRTAEGYLLDGLSGPGLAERADVVVVPAQGERRTVKIDGGFLSVDKDVVTVVAQHVEMAGV